MPHSEPNRTYYGTDTRAYELLAGAFIALVPALVVAAKQYRQATRTATTASVAALLIAATAWVHLDAIERGIAVTVITCVLIVALEASDRGAVKRVLSTRTAVFLGKISYGTYLWHWLVVLVLLRTFQISTLSTIGIAALVATALATLSYELLEHPIRTAELLNRHRGIVVATGLAVTIISALILIPAIVDPASAASPTARSSSTSGFTPVPRDLDWQHATAGRGPFVNCFAQPARKCTIVHGTGVHILLIGDSHAWMLIPSFTEIARRENLTLSVSVRGVYPWQQDL